MKYEKLYLHAGNNDTPQKISGPVNFYSFLVSWIPGDSKCPVTRDFKVNDAFYVSLKQAANTARAAGSRLVVICASTCTLRSCKNLILHRNNGGPIVNNNGVGEFYKNNECIYILKSMLSNISKELPQNQYKCLSINLMWEFYCGIYTKGGMKWAVDMCHLWQNDLNEKRSIGFGSPFVSHLAEINKAIKEPAEIYSEAYDFKKFLQVNSKFTRKQIIDMNVTFYGYWAGGESLYWNSKGYYPKAAEYFRHGNEKRNAARAIDNMYSMISYHINPSLPFKQEVYGGKVISKWWHDRAGIDVTPYDFDEVYSNIILFAASERFRAVMENPTKETLRSLRKYKNHVISVLNK